jgi:hypothetical protein
MQRGKWQGMLAIARFNWPFYVAALVVMVGAASVAWMAGSPLIRITAALGFGGAAYFFVGSLGVSHLIYDRSDLYRWRWLGRACGGLSGKDLAICHCGFDEVSRSVGEHLPGNRWIVLDHFDPERMTEASIQRARRHFPPTPGTLAAPFDRWPVGTASLDGVFGLLAIHELRSEDERAAWFAEARRCLKEDGRVVIAEHTRDLANFVAFGPGFLHFHSPSSWVRCAAQAGLILADEFRVTPWVRIFVFQ